MWTLLGVFSIAYLIAVITIAVIEAQEARLLAENEDNASSVSYSEVHEQSLLEEASGCLWSNLIKCEMECASMDYADIEPSVVELFRNSSCQPPGIKLTLGAKIVYPLNVIQANFFVTPVKIVELHIMCQDIGTIQRNAFASPTMGALPVLTLERATFRQLSKTHLRGLTSLTTLTLLNCSIETFESGAFDILAPTLSILTLSQADPQMEILQAKLLTGSVEMTALHYVKFKYNMKNTITNETFVGVPMLTTLDLSSCQIETIGPNSFDRLRSLLFVRLNDNKLKNLPVGLFDSLLPNGVLLIDLTNNAWVCDCDVCYAKSLIANVLNFRADKNVCLTPDNTISDGKVCNDTKCYETLGSTETTTPNTTTAQPNTTYEVETQQCQLEDSSNWVEIVMIRSKTQPLQIQENTDGSITLRVKKKSFNNTLLVWFASGDSHHIQGSLNPNDFDCRLSQMTSNSLITRSIQLDNIQPNMPYTFCLMENESKDYVVSPFNCLSYNKYERKEDDGWLLKSSKDLAIGMIVFVSILLLMLGMVIGYLLIRRHPSWLRGGSNVVFVRSASDGSVMDRKMGKNPDWNRRISEVSTISANSYACTTGPSRFEIVQRQLELERNQRGETQYYMQTVANTSTMSNVYESSSQTPTSEAPTRPASYSTVMKIERVQEEPEPENYYSNAELMFGQTDNVKQI